MGDIIIDPELHALIPPLRPEEREGLEASLKAEGCRDPLVVWGDPCPFSADVDMVLLDGHNRLEICRRLDIRFKREIIALDSRLDAKIWIRRNQVRRRNLTDDQRAMNAAYLAELEEEKSKRERATVAGKVGGAIAGRGRPKAIGSGTDVIPKPIPKAKARPRTQAAKAAGVSERKVRKAQVIIRDAPPEVAAQVTAGEVSLADATREIKRKAVVKKLEAVETKAAKAIEGVYDVVIVDPPWPLEKIERDERPNQTGLDYPTMSIEELEGLTLPCAKDCHVWLWATHRFLPVAFKLLEAWGLKYVCCFVWAKAGGMQPIGLPQYNCEMAIYGRKGAPVFIDTKAFPVCFEAPRGKHSEKPEVFYETVRRVTAGRRIDMFGRKRREGFDVFGKEAPE